MKPQLNERIDDLDAEFLYSEKWICGWMTKWIPISHFFHTHKLIFSLFALLCAFLSVRNHHFVSSKRILKSVLYIFLLACDNIKEWNIDIQHMHPTKHILLHECDETNSMTFESKSDRSGAVLSEQTDDLQINSSHLLVIQGERKRHTEARINNKIHRPEMLCLLMFRLHQLPLESSYIDECAHERFYLFELRIRTFVRNDFLFFFLSLLITFHSHSSHKF